MINDFRILTKSKLDEISELGVGRPQADSMIEEGVYYFGYTITVSSVRNNLDYSNTQKIINITGYLTTKNGTLAKFDEYTDAIVDKLAELRIRCTTNDMSTLDGIRKVLISGSTTYNTIEGQLR